MNDMVQQIITRYEKLSGDRGIWESHWQEIGDQVFPRQREFTVHKTKGEKNQEKVFDSTAVLGLERFAATLESMLTPRSQKWHRLKASDDALNRNQSVAKWFDEANRILFNMRYTPKANFASQMNEIYMSLGAFGTGTMFIDEMDNTGLRYKAIHLNDIYFCTNHQGLIDTVYRKFKFSARQAVQAFGCENLSEGICTACENDPEKDFEFIHVVMPNDECEGNIFTNDMKFHSYYIDLMEKSLVKESGYRTFPYAISRYVVSPNEIYGRSPAMSVLPDIKMVNEMQKTTIKAAHRAIDPPLLMRDDGILSTFSLKPGALNFGGVDQNGKQMVIPLQNGMNFQLAEDQKERVRKTINDAFLVTLFQILVENPRMTATEVMERAQEKGALLAPAMGRQQTELLGPLVERELDILSQLGVLPEMPGLLIEAQGDYQIEYDSPMSRMQRAEEVVGIQRMMQDIIPLVNFDPSVVDLINPDEYARVVSEVHGVPFRILRTPEEIAAIRTNRAAQQQQAQESALAQQQAATMKDAAAAGKDAGLTNE